MREVINHLTHIHLLNTIKSILTQTLEKLCNKRVHGMEDFDNLYFWNTLNKTHYGILVWNRNIKDCIQLIRSMCINREKKNTWIDRWKNVITTSSNIYQIDTRFAITKWSQDRCTKTKYLKEKEKKRYKKSSLHSS